MWEGETGNDDVDEVVSGDEDVEKTEVEGAELDEADESGERGERVRWVGVSVSFRRSGSKGELAGEGVSSFW